MPALWAIDFHLNRLGISQLNNPCYGLFACEVPGYPDLVEIQGYRASGYYDAEAIADLLSGQLFLNIDEFWMISYRFAVQLPVGV